MPAALTIVGRDDGTADPLRNPAGITKLYLLVI